MRGRNAFLIMERHECELIFEVVARVRSVAGMAYMQIASIWYLKLLYVRRCSRYILQVLVRFDSYPEIYVQLRNIVNPFSFHML